ncbi:MAG: MOSC domain-containing protein [Anaerolineales bacterium]|nr:MOSC domain-containing protein [Anaerolineales bacterium]
MGLYLGLDPDSFITTRQSQVKVTFAGFEGDRHSGITRRSDGRTPQYPRGTEIRSDRQVSILSMEELDEIAAALDVPQILPEWLGANLLLSGISRLTLLPPSTRLFFSGGVTLVVSQLNLPCLGPGGLIEEKYQRQGLAALFVKQAARLRGLVAVVEMPGTLCEGETVQAEIPEQVIYGDRLGD